VTIRITIPHDNPYMRAMVGANKVKRDVLSALVAGDIEPYVEFVAREGYSAEVARSAALRRVALADWVRSEGYDERKAEAYSIAHGEDWGPIAVTIDGRGHLHNLDGGHRICILSALAVPIPVTVYWVSPAWSRMIAWAREAGLSQEFAHPLLLDVQPRHQCKPQYLAITEWLRLQGCASVFEVDPLEGVGAVTLASSGLSVKARARDWHYHPLLRSWGAANGYPPVEVAAEYDASGCDAVVGLSAFAGPPDNRWTVAGWLDWTGKARYQVLAVPNRRVLKQIQDRGNYPQDCTLWTDATTQTVALWRDS